ncbi:MAG: DNA translocase FtsK [Pelolinea sp.]|nr:DNA translocase FtsK [Pelolinea sp.]
MSQKSNFSTILFKTIKRFGQDLLGILLITLAVISLLSLLNLTEGSLSSFFSQWILKGFGWGSFILVGLIGYIGFLILLRHLEQLPRLNLGRIILLELSMFALLALLSIINGLSIDRAVKGVDGGVVGWGLARIFRDLVGLPISAVLFLVIFLIFFISGIGLWHPLMEILDRYLTRILFTSQPPNFSASLKQQGSDSLSKEQKTNPNAGNQSDALVAPLRSQIDLPPLDLLLEAQKSISDESFIHAKAIQIEKTMEEFGVPARVAGYRVGPTIIQYAVEPGFVEKVNEEGDVSRKKVRVAQISSLHRDLTLALAVDRLRIEAPIPNHSYVGIEIPNQNSTVVRLKSVIQSETFSKSRSPLKLALGLDVSGNPVIADLARMPHLLVAGTTGSGKSVCITSFIACLAFNNSPDDLKMAILDPKMVELVRFNGLPHLFGKVETQLDRMLGILAWATKEMEDRYRLMEAVNARDLDTYNLKMMRRGHAKLPKIVIFIDELADLMLSAPDQTEGYLVRLAQMARATGIHLVVATQRPSTDIITGLIKANFPARISFMMATSIDSRVILDSNGAETLMGRGDLLFIDPEASGPLRAQGVLVDDREIEKIIAYWQNKTSEQSQENIAPWEDLIPIIGNDSDRLIEAAIELIKKEGRASTSRLQRKLRIGFPRAARLMDELEERGIVGPSEAGGREREVLLNEDDSPEPEEF